MLDSSAQTFVVRAAALVKINVFKCRDISTVKRHAKERQEEAARPVAIAGVRRHSILVVRRKSKVVHKNSGYRVIIKAVATNVG